MSASLRYPESGPPLPRPVLLEGVAGRPVVEVYPLRVNIVRSGDPGAELALTLSKRVRPLMLSCNVAAHSTPCDGACY